MKEGRECIDILLSSITRLVYLSFNEGFIPLEFKKAVVATPMIKKITS